MRPAFVVLSSQLAVRGYEHTKSVALGQCQGCGLLLPCCASPTFAAVSSGPSLGMTSLGLAVQAALGVYMHVS